MQRFVLKMQTIGYCYIGSGLECKLGLLLRHSEPIVTSHILLKNLLLYELVCEYRSTVTSLSGIDSLGEYR